MTVWPSDIVSPILINGGAPGSGDKKTVPTIGDVTGVPLGSFSASFSFESEVVGVVEKLTASVGVERVVALTTRIRFPVLSNSISVNPVSFNKSAIFLTRSGSISNLFL